MEIVASHAMSDAAYERSARVLFEATTALMGRVNDAEFYGYWPPVADDETADPRDRAIARWLNEWTAMGLPPGLSISTAGVISGTPTVRGTSSVTATATDSVGGTGSTSFTWTIKRH